MIFKKRLLGAVLTAIILFCGCNNRDLTKSRAALKAEETAQILERLGNPPELPELGRFARLTITAQIMLDEIRNRVFYIKPTMLDVKRRKDGSLVVIADSFSAKFILTASEGGLREFIANQSVQRMGKLTDAIITFVPVRLENSDFSISSGSCSGEDDDSTPELSAEISSQNIIYGELKSITAYSDKLQ